ncbi:CYTH-like domain-containing protein [Aphelenchoides besseyi]|nr:CYTH-like domain-containing protein [Aphelenchoides besseyi]KAI6209879.1 CYTH-like domain-containing protein [Aphelenchoides besseyi]
MELDSRISKFSSKSPLRQRAPSTEPSSEEEVRSEGSYSFEELLRQSGVHPAGPSSDYSSGNESADCAEPPFCYSRSSRKLVHQSSFHPADILANTVASVDLDSELSSPLFKMSEPDPTKPLNKKRIYKLVLTGGPCGGKTTGQERLGTFFENAGWKVFTVPETATILLGGGVKFAELNAEQSYAFQRDLLATLLRIEQTLFTQAAMVAERNVLVICDRGAMDPSAYMDQAGWDQIMKDLNLNAFELRDARYNQVVHMVTAADGAEGFYTVANNKARSEGIREALDQDRATRNAWIGHPYVDVVDNSNVRKFDDKILKLISVVCDRVGLDYQDRLAPNSRKRKWLVSSIDFDRFPKYEEFEVTHDYLLADKPDIQVRIRTRCQNNRFTYTITTRQYVKNEPVETRMQITEREYQRYLTMKDMNRCTIFKRRRCFNYGTQYFHLDIYVQPLPPACNGAQSLMILETYTTHPVGSPEPSLPEFLKVEREITNEAGYSMYQLSRFKSASVPLLQHNGVPKVVA